VISPQFWLIAGANGSGKTTIAKSPQFRALLSNIPIFNPDVMTQEILATSPSLGLTEANIRAAQETERRVDAAIDDRQSFGVETVLSTTKYLPRVIRARSEGFVTAMLYVALKTPNLAVERVALRVAAGGHAVPEEKIRSRWQRSHEALAVFARQVDTLFVIDNSGEIPVLVAKKGAGVITVIEHERLPMVEQVLIGS
jgi:predicted ABC-type ATPase